MYIFSCLYPSLYIYPSLSLPLSNPLSPPPSLPLPLIFIKHFRESILQLFSVAICQFGSIKWSRERSALPPGSCEPPLACLQLVLGASLYLVNPGQERRWPALVATSAHLPNQAAG